MRHSRRLFCREPNVYSFYPALRFESLPLSNLCRGAVICLWKVVVALILGPLSLLPSLSQIYLVKKIQVVPLYLKINK